MAEPKPGRGIDRMPSGNYRVRWTDENGKRACKGGFRSMADARAFQRRVLDDGGKQRAQPDPLWAKMLREQLGNRASIELAEFNPQGFFVYLLWPARMDKPFYIGQSINVLARVGAHMANPDRRHRVERVTLVRCHDEQTMLETEARLIQFYEPELNVLGPERQKVWRVITQTAPGP